MTTGVPFIRNEATQHTIQKLLDENAHLIRTIVENMNMKGKAMECIQYQQLLHKNLVYLASIADPYLNIHAILPVSTS
jgi:protein SSXT